MPEFAYEALTSAGSVVRGAMSADDETALDVRLREQGSYLIRAQSRREAARPAYTDGQISRQELGAFTEFLAGGARAGLPLLTLLEDVEHQLESKRMKAIVAEIRHSVSVEGKSLSEALREHPKTFPQLYVGSVEAGEASGQLDFVLGQLVDYLDWQQGITTQLRQATFYPTFVLSAILLLVVALLTFVYPRLLPLLESFQVEPPLPTRVLMGVSMFLQGHWPLVVAGAVGLAVGLLVALRTDRGRWIFDSMSLKLPIFGRFIAEVNMARFATYTALFYRAGVELIHGLRLVEGMLPNRVLAAAVRQAREEIAGGESMAAAFGRTGRFPPIVIRAVALGESTGGLDEALGRAKLYYDREIPAAARRILTSVQPLLVVFLGAVVTMIALSIFLPILTIYQSAGAR